MNKFPNYNLKAPHKLLIFTLVIGVYFCIGMASLKLATLNDFTSPLWAPAGLSIGSLLLFGPWLTPAIFLGAFLTNLTIGTSIIGVSIIAFGNMLEAFVAYKVIRWIIEKGFFKNYSEFIALLVGISLGAIVSATIGMSSLIMNEILTWHEFIYTWFTWWSGNFVGSMIVLPLIMKICLRPRRSFLFKPKKIILSLILVPLYCSLIHLVFMNQLNQAFAWLICPLLIPTGFYLGTMVPRIYLIIMAIQITWLTSQGHGTFEFGDLNLNLLYVQCLLISFSFSSLLTRAFSLSHRPGKSFIVTNVLGWLGIFIVIYMTASVEKHHIMQDLEDSINSSNKSLIETTHQYALLLRNGSHFIRMNPNLKSHEWNKYVTGLDPDRYYNAINGMGFIRPVKKNEVSKFLDDMAQRGISNLQLKILDQKYSQQFDSHHVISFIEPRDSNLPALGLDTGSERNRREAAELALRTQTSVASKPIKLVQDEIQRPAFLVFHPVGNQENFLGWVYLPILTETFFAKGFSPHSGMLKLDILIDNKNVFKSYLQKNNFLFNEQFLKKGVLTFFGQQYQLQYYPTSNFFKRHSHSTAPLAMLMNILMFLIAGFLIEQMTFTQRAELLIKKRTEQLEASKAQLIQSSKMASLGEMASGMAHEINNPITIIMGKIKVIQLILLDLKVDHPVLYKEIGIIEKTSDRISKIIKGLKTFSRTVEDDPFQEISLESIFQETLDLCGERIKANGIDLTIQAFPKVTIPCRPNEISQVLLNLFNNSMDALNSVKEKRIQVEFHSTKKDFLVISIIDTGPGIPNEIADRIMEPFFTTKSVGKGTGLGLSIAKGIIEGHHGSLWLDKTSIQTRFVIELPYYEII